MATKNFRQDPLFATPHRGIRQKTVNVISSYKNEPAWMKQKRDQGLQFFRQRKKPTWGANLSALDLQNIYYYIPPAARKHHPEGDRPVGEETWDDLPKTVKDTFEKLKIPEYERKFLAGVGVQYDSENIYHSLTKEARNKGVIFSDIETAAKKYPALVKKYFGTVISANDNMFAALNTAVWSGDSFVYVPKGVQLTRPLQAYFRINARTMGQFERTLIIADEGSFVHYIEGCSAPIYIASSLHAAVVEIIALKGARIRYSTVQNWSQNIFNLVTKRAHAHENAIIEWIDFNFGARASMKYPAVFLVGKNAKADILSMAFAGRGQHQDTGAKVIHVAPHTTSRITSKSISALSGRNSFRGLVQIGPQAKKSRVNVQCDALILDKNSRSDTYPTIKALTKDTIIEHEASVSKINEEQLFYLQSRGISEQEAKVMLVNGFIEPLVKELPMEFAVEMNRLIQLEMEGGVG